MLLLIFRVGYAQETKYLSENYEFKKGDIAYMFGDDVKLRDKPNVESNVLTLLKIGEQIEVIDKSDSIMEFDGIDSPWYKVKTNNNVGFVLGNLISLDKATNGSLIYLISLKKDGPKLFAKTRVLESGSNFTENVSQLMTGEFSVRASGNNGLENIKSVFEIDYLAESCGVNGGGIYLFYDGESLIKAIDYTQVADADAYWYIEEYIFPNDKEGKKGKIVYRREIGETKEYETEWVETKLTRRILEWNGKEIFPKIGSEEE